MPFNQEPVWSKKWPLKLMAKKLKLEFLIDITSKDLLLHLKQLDFLFVHTVSVN